MLLQVASRRATPAELGDVMEEYVACGRSAGWLVSQTLSTVRRRRSHLTMAERGTEMLSTLRNDIRYALRTLGRNPGFAVAGIVPIALGIGLNTAAFSILNSVAWRSLPARNPAALVSIHQEFRGGPGRTVYGARSLFSIPEYRTYRDEAHTLSGLMAYSRWWSVTLGRESPQEIDGILVTCNYFDVLGLSPAIGTGFTPANCGPAGTPPVVVLSHALWQGAFGGDPNILQKPVVLNGHDVTVVGVAPAGFDGVDLAKTTFFAPTSMAGLLRPEQQHLHENPHVSWLTLIGRRRTDADTAQVRTDLATIARRIDQEQSGRTTSLVIEPAAALSLPVQRRDVLRGAAIVMAGFGLVLLIAAANVANILLARAAGRAREIAIRVSVGANRGRLVQQLLTESAVIALAGALWGALIFSWSFQVFIRWLVTSIPGADPLRFDPTPDRTVFWFAIGLTATTALLCGLVPALQASKGDISAVMKNDGADSTGTRSWLRATLIGAQVTLCTMLLIPAGLLSHALYAAYTLDPGFDYRNVAMVSIDLRGPRYEKDNAAIFYRQWLERVSSQPGVEGIARASRAPLSPGRSQATFRIGDEPEGRVFDVNVVSPEFFSLLEMPIVRGRVFTEGEVDAALVTESTARHYWPGQDAIGRAITAGDVRRHIVGIVRDAQVSQAQGAIASYIYVPATQGTQQRISVLARTRVDFDGLAAAVRAETARMDPALVVNIRRLADNLGILQTLSRIAASVAGILSLLALGLAALGIYGVVAYIVSRRRREVAVRLALGASAHDVQRLIMSQTLRPVAVGMAIGVALAAASARVLQAALFGVSPYDPIAFIGVPLLMLSIAAAAALMPTRRAMRLEPMSVLRSE